MYLTDSGLETDLIFHHGYDLPHFAAFVLLDDEAGVEVLRAYYRDHAAAAAAAGAGFVLEAPTWRASPDWGRKVGYSLDALADANRRAIDLLVDVRHELDETHTPAIISGCIGPRGDGYAPADTMSDEAACDYHTWQVERFAETDADIVTAMTMTYTAEAIGVVTAAKNSAMPVVIAFTVETDGRLPDGTEIGIAIAIVDDATSGYASYYMINCAHPSHFAFKLTPASAWAARIGGVRANASRKSHAELDEADELDDGDPAELAADYSQLLDLLPQLNVLGGCCGTDIRHVRAIAAACIPQ